MERDEVNVKVNGFHAFRTGWPNYHSSVFRDKVEIVTNGHGRIIGVTNPLSLRYAVIPSSAEGIQILEIGKNAFSECKNLRSIVFSDNLEYCGEGAFAGTENLEECVFSSKEIEFGDAVFSSSGIKSFSFPSKCTMVPSRFFQDAKRLFSVSMPVGLKRIGTLSFAGTKSLRSIDLGFRLKEIPDGAFLSSGIESISLSNTIKRIGVSAFSMAYRLESIWYDGSPEGFRGMDFGIHWNKGIAKNAVLYVKNEEGGWVNAFEMKSTNKGKEEGKVDPVLEKHLKILGFDSLPTHSILMERYRSLSRKFHPDSISSLGLDQEFLEFASKRFIEIHDAYLYISQVIKK